MGYADQAHLTREWNSIAGCSPRQWMAEELPFLQDLPSDRAAESEP
jgi:AraC-like DNA-binding protein